jgi:rhs family protein
MPFNDLAQSSSAKRGFADLFADSKAALDNIQAGLGGMLPSMPGMPVAKFGDLSIGIDMHPTVTPPSPVMPVPHVGKIYDLMADIMAGIAAAIPPATSGIAGVACNVLKGMAPSVKVHNQWIAQAGISILHLPAFVLHPAPLVSGMSESEMWMGSSTVLADGAPCSTLTHPSLSCNLVGIPTIPRKGKPKKVSKALMAPTSMLSTITSVGKPVLVGGPPTIDLFALTMKLGLKGLCKRFKSFRNFTKKFTHKVHQYIESLGLNPNLTKILKKTACFVLGEPVDVATGRVYHTNVDFELPGPIPLVWERTYYSDAWVDGPLGFGWHHSYNIGILPLGNEAFLLRHTDGRESGLPVLLPDGEWFDRKEQLHWKHDADGYLLTDAKGFQYRFNGPQNVHGYYMVSSISTRDGFSIHFSYTAKGYLAEIISSRGECLSIDTDEQGHVLCVSLKQPNNEDIKLVRYKYDNQGNMVETIDSLDVSKYFLYENQHLLTRLINQGGMSFHWEYEGHDENARCIHTWGDGGVMEYFFKYGKGYTHARNGENAVTEYFYGSDKLIYKIIDANGGITRYRYNVFEELEVTINPEGYTRKTVCDNFGFPVRITDENGEDTWLQYDNNHNLTSLRTPEGRQLTWKYDEQDRLVSRTTMNGQTIRYSYKDGLLHTITDGQGRVYTLLFSSHYELESLVFPNGLSRHWFYDNRGRLIEATDIKGNITRYAYDRADNLIRLEEPDGNVHHFEYDAMGNMIHAKDNIREVKFTYGALGILKSREQERHRITFGYNSELQLRRIGNEAGENYFFELDGLGQVITEIGFDGLRREYERDGSGRVTRVNRPGGKWTGYLYDGLDHILKEEQYDGEVSLYTYDKDGLLVKAQNAENLLEFTRDRRTGLVTGEKQGEYTVSRTYDSEGNCTRITSSLGADIRHTYDREGNLQTMQAGEGWQASWVRDNTGLEVQRTFSGGVTVRTERDRFGREVRKSVRAGGIERGAYRYEWGIAGRLLAKENELTGTLMRYDYDRFDFLIRQEMTNGSETDVIYRVPDFVGNLFETPEKKDRKYGPGGRLLEDPSCFYHYDDEGNLIFREFKELQDNAVPHDRKRMEKERGIRCLATGMGWLYEWASNGMLKKVIRPDGRPVEFRYDALGRRTAKRYFGKVTRWVWDGNVPLHEWCYKAIGLQSYEEENIPPKEPTEDITTWVFEADTFVPAAKIQGGKQYSIVTDYLGTPVQMYDGQGNKTWDCTLDIYGKVFAVDKGTEFDCPFRFQGQYADEETGLYYNRFRYYLPHIGMYFTPDPIRIVGNNPTLYGYVFDNNMQIDPLGLMPIKGGKTPSGLSRATTKWLNQYGPSAMRAHHLIPQEMLSNKIFMQHLNKLTGGKGSDYIHRQIAIVTNGLHQNIHANGWNNDFKKWANTNESFSLKDLQKQIKKMMREYNIPKSSRNYATKYGCH